MCVSGHLPSNHWSTSGSVTLSITWLFVGIFNSMQFSSFAGEKEKRLPYFCESLEASYHYSLNIKVDSGLIVHWGEKEMTQHAITLRTKTTTDITALFMRQGESRLTLTGGRLLLFSAFSLLESYFCWEETAWLIVFVSHRVSNFNRRINCKDPCCLLTRNVALSHRLLFFRIARHVSRPILLLFFYF